MIMLCPLCDICRGADTGENTAHNAQSDVRGKKWGGKASQDKTGVCPCYVRKPGSPHNNVVCGVFHSFAISRFSKDFNAITTPGNRKISFLGMLFMKTPNTIETNNNRTPVEICFLLQKDSSRCAFYIKSRKFSMKSDKWTAHFFYAIEDSFCFPVAILSFLLDHQFRTGNYLSFEEPHAPQATKSEQHQSLRTVGSWPQQKKRQTRGGHRQPDSPCPANHPHCGCCSS